MTGPRGRGGAGLVVGGAVALALAPGAAAGHQVGLSRGLYRVDGASVRATLVFARGETRLLAPEVDADGDGALSEVELLAGAGALDAAAIQATMVMIDGAACAASFEGARLSEEDGLELDARYRCPAAGARLTIDFGPARALGRAHRHVARVVADGMTTVGAERVLHRLRPRVEVEMGRVRAAAEAVEARVGASGGAGASGEASGEERGEATGDAGAESPGDARARGGVARARGGEGVWAPSAPTVERERAPFFALGVEHILTGFDHLVFLLGLVLVRGSLRSLMAVVTAFTVGHSLSLGLGVLGGWTPSPAIVEPLIALSIVYVGLEDLWARELRGRWRLTLAFGFVHGFGFAGALAEIGVPAGDVGAILVLFNLGVEAGQLAALAVALPILGIVGRALGERPWRRWLAVAIALAGLGWFIERAWALV